VCERQQGKAGKAGSRHMRGGPNRESGAKIIIIKYKLEDMISPMPQNKERTRIEFNKVKYSINHWAPRDQSETDPDGPPQAE
jgi:hypothetical protein